ncbi:MAG: DedA family protein [Planctomycetes bacterium]|jgi:membrane protein DedA with SNARE-associated domain|nr:DedA family protein [Planctomycetota bacterium]
MFSTLIGGLLAFSAKMGYPGIVLLMAVESSFIPFPSEVVIPPAAYLAAQGHFNVFLVIISGIIGSLLGACLNYFLALTLGRKAMFKLAARPWAKWLLVSEKKLTQAENYFLQYGRISTFFGRLVPAVRQLISLPAGFSRMRFSIFIFYTVLGSGVWVTILAALGYYFGANPELLSSYYREISYFFVCLAAVIAGYYFLRRKKQPPAGA